ncbi:MAG: sigma-70 family RNA polymerase sigma factor, partial [Oscillospiraceae bacterium]|nr:sigma-70 family RNA polymerase sigma factor [Oscillospiraceae bacterium]
MDLSQARGGAEEIVDKYADMVFRIAFSQTKNRADADDVFQDVFLKLFRSEAVFDSEEHIKAWLIRVAVNTSRKLFASAWNRRTVPLTDELPYEDEPPGGGVLDAV